MRKITLILLIIFSINYLHSQIVFEMISPEDSLVNEYLKMGSVLKLEIKDYKSKQILQNILVKVINDRNNKIDSFIIIEDKHIFIKLDTSTTYRIIASEIKEPCVSQYYYYIPYSILINTKNDKLIYKTMFLEKVIECVFFENIFYDFDKYFIRPDAIIELNKILFEMQKCSKIIFEINSYSDCTEKNPLELSMKRSKAVVDYLVSKGIDRNRLKYFAYGATQSQSGCDCSKKCNVAELQQDRRTEFKIISYK